MTDSARRLDDWNGPDLRRLADEHGTPLYILDLDRAEANYRRLTRAFSKATVKYAAKANAGGHVLQRLIGVGVGIECGSPGEVDRALAAGADPGTTQYTAVNPPASALDHACEIASESPDFTLTAGARDTVDRLADRGFAGRMLLRVNPDIGAGHHEKVITGTNPKFGVPADRVPEVLARATERGLDVRGLHAHAGSGMLGDEMDEHRRFCRRMANFAREAPLRIETIDIGGGLGVPYHETDQPLDLDAVAEATRQAFAEMDAELVLEPGRYVVADAGLLLTRVNTIKPTPETLVVGVDAGMTTLLRPALYGAYHPLRNLAPDAGRREPVECMVGGPICESSDVLARGRVLPEPERDDLLAIGNAGAYGYEMTLQFHSQPRPATIALTGDEAVLARRRETVEDITHLEQGHGLQE